MEETKIEIELGNNSLLEEALRVSVLVFEPTEAEKKKYHDLEDWRRRLDNEGMLVVGKANGEVVGFVLAYLTGDGVMHVWNAGVLKEYRKMGIFSNMFEELAVECKRRGIKKITLNTIEQKFPQMYKFVINKGFEEYEKEWIDDEKVGKVEKSKFELRI